MEKRKCIRFEGPSTIGVTVVEPKGVEILAAIKDVSRIGLSLRVNKFLNKGRNLTLEIYMLSREEPIITVAKVKWVKKKMGTKDYVVGIEFIDIKKDDMADLLSCVYEQWKIKIPKIKF